MVIAIDGPAGAGKSTIAAALARDLGFLGVNSGRIYRAFVYGALQAGVDVYDEDAFFDYAKNADIDYNAGDVKLDGCVVTAHLHTAQIDEMAPRASANVRVRHLVNDIVRGIAEKVNIVVEGRDMTTVVFPNAKGRFYVDAAVSERAKRRYNEAGGKETLAEIENAIIARDKIDSEKGEGALKLGEGVFYIDTTQLAINEICSIIKGRVF